MIDAGYTVELDVWDWAAGTNFVDAMRIALERADRVLAIYTDAYFAGRYTQVEHTAAFTAAVEGRSGRVVPILVEDCKVPELYAPLVRIVLAGLDRDEARRRLFAGVLAPSAPRRPTVELPGSTEIVPIGDQHFPRRTTSIWNVPPRNPFFTGRSRLLDILHSRLRQTAENGGGSVAVAPLQGIGGVGKTQLAVEYAHRHPGEYRIVWWVNADDPALATAGLVNLAGALALPVDGPPSTILRRLWAELRDRSDWLLVYDNVDDPTSIAELRPPQGGNLLLTSRSPTLHRLADLIEVGEFDRNESIALLQRRSPTLTHAEADRVAAAVGDLPLAVEQAGCFLTDTRIEVDDYLELLATQPAQAGLADSTLDRHPGLVAVVTANRARLNTESPSAAALLNQLAFCASEPLSLTPRRERAMRVGFPERFGAKFGDAAATAGAVRHLTRLGLVRHVGTTLQAHRLVQALVRSQLSAEEQMASRQAAQLLVASASPGDPDDPGSWPSYAALVPHVHTLSAQEDGAAIEPKPFRELLLATTRYQYVSGQSAAGRNLAEQTRLCWAQTLGADAPDTLRVANNLAIYLRQLGDLAGARALHEDTLARRRRILGDDHPDTLQSANGLGACLWATGDFAGARALSEETLAHRRRVLGDDHPDTLRSANNLAIYRRRMGDIAGARALSKDAFTRRRRIFGGDHPSTLHSANNLAEDLRKLGDAAGAQRLDEDTLERRRRVLGVDHPETFRTVDNLAEDLRSLGDVAGARTLHEDTLARRRRVLGEDHPDTLISAAGLAACLAELGDAAGAHALYEDTLARRRRVLGEDHPDTLVAAAGLEACGGGARSQDQP